MKGIFCFLKKYDFKSLDETEDQSIKEWKNLFWIFDTLPATINKLEASGLKMETAVQLI